ncbi:unnamed protein product, partial [Lymnaea stagnalis]
MGDGGAVVYLLVLIMVSASAHSGGKAGTSGGNYESRQFETDNSGSSGKFYGSFGSDNSGASTGKKYSVDTSGKNSAEVLGSKGSGGQKGTDTNKGKDNSANKGESGGNRFASYRAQTGYSGSAGKGYGSYASSNTDNSGKSIKAGVSGNKGSSNRFYDTKGGSFGDYPSDYSKQNGGPGGQDSLDTKSSDFSHKVISGNEGIDIGAGFDESGFGGKSSGLDGGFRGKGTGYDDSGFDGQASGAGGKWSGYDYNGYDNSGSGAKGVNSDDGFAHKQISEIVSGKGDASGHQEGSSDDDQSASAGSGKEYDYSSSNGGKSGGGGSLVQDLSGLSGIDIGTDSGFNHKDSGAGNVDSVGKEGYNSGYSGKGVGYDDSGASGKGSGYDNSGFVGKGAGYDGSGSSGKGSGYDNSGFGGKGSGYDNSGFGGKGSGYDNSGFGGKGAGYEDSG